MEESEWLDIFGDTLRLYLRMSGMSQRDLADRANLSDTSVSAYLNKQKMPGVRALINISYVLDVDLDELVGFADRII